MIEKYKKREEERVKVQNGEDKYVEKHNRDRNNLSPFKKVTPHASQEEMATVIQKHWRGYVMRKFNTIGTRKKFKVGKGLLLWRTYRYISIYKYDKLISKEMNLLIVNLSPDETYILIKAFPREKQRSEWISLKVYVKELIEYFEIDLVHNSNLFKSSNEKFNSIKNFTACFLESLYIEDKTLKFNQRKKLQKLIELLNEDSVLNLEESERSRSADDDQLSIQSNVEFALRKNNYEQYLDLITTRVQKRVKGFLARKLFQMRRDMGILLSLRKYQSL